jgi:hypothetical protein
MRLQFWITMVLAALAVSCTTGQQEEMAQATAVRSAPAKTIRCASADLQPQSDPCSGKTMAGQRPPRG